jgi:acetylglutamate kinase
MRTVIKIGGSVLDPAPAPALLQALVARLGGGEQIALVHGGGKALTELLRDLGIATTFRGGLRVTDAPTLRAAIMTLAGTVNKQLTAALNAAAGRPVAAGFCGLDGDCVVATRMTREFGFVGDVAGGNPALLEAVLRAGFAPVLASIASDGHGGALNVNADQFAAACAQMLSADCITFVTDVPGVLDASGAPIPAVTLDELETMIASGAISAGMLPKVASCRAALDAGVRVVEVVGVEALEPTGAVDTAEARAPHAPRSPGTRILRSAQPDAAAEQPATHAADFPSVRG